MSRLKTIKKEEGWPTEVASVVGVDQGAVLGAPEQADDVAFGDGRAVALRHVLVELLARVAWQRVREGPGGADPVTVIGVVILPAGAPVEGQLALAVDQAEDKQTATIFFDLAPPTVSSERQS